ncbi:MAG: hypothetical protein U0W40_17260 [Acidimicrobiia bacterium]
MDVRAIGNGNAWGLLGAGNGNNGHRFGRVDQAFSAAAKLLGESADRLRTELRAGGNSLTSLAATKGVSKDDLVGALKQGIQATHGGAKLSDDQLTAMATHLADRVEHGWHHQRPEIHTQVTPTTPAPDTTSTAANAANAANAATASGSIPTYL